MHGDSCISFFYLLLAIASLHVESNVLPLDLHKELLIVKALIHPFLLLSSPLRSLLTSEDLDSYSWRFSLLVHS